MVLRMWEVAKVLPERGKRIQVLIGNEKYDAELWHNDFIFTDDSRNRLGIKNMNDSYHKALNITHWEYK